MNGEHADSTDFQLKVALRKPTTKRVCQPPRGRRGPSVRKAGVGQDKTAGAVCRKVGAGVPLRPQPVTCGGLSCRQRVECVTDCIAGAVAQDNADDRAKLRRYVEQKAARREGAHWCLYHAPRQQGEEGDFACRQFEPAANRRGQHARLTVEPPVVCHPAAGCLENGVEFEQFHRLDEIVIGAANQAVDFVLGLSARSQHHDAAVAMPGPEPHGRIEAAPVRQHHVDDREGEIRRPFLEIRDRTGLIDGPAAFFQQRGDFFAQLDLAVEQQHFGHTANLDPHCVVADSLLMSVPIGGAAALDSAMQPSSAPRLPARRRRGDFSRTRRLRSCFVATIEARDEREASAGKPCRHVSPTGQREARRACRAPSGRAALLDGARADLREIQAAEAGVVVPACLRGVAVATVAVVARRHVVE